VINGVDRVLLHLFLLVMLALLIVAELYLCTMT